LQQRDSNTRAGYYPRVAQVSFTQVTLPFPAILDAQALKDLDLIVDQFEADARRALEDETKANLEALELEFTAETKDWEKEHKRKAARSLLEHYSEKAERRVTLVLKGDRVWKGRTFAAAMGDAPIGSDIPLGFLLRCDAYRKSLRGGDRGFLVLTFSADDQEALARLRSWAAKVEARVWTRWWCATGSILSPMGWIIPLFIASILPLTFASGDNTARDQAHELLRKGLRPEDQQKALELILSLTSKYEPAGQGIHFPHWYWWTVGLLAVSYLCFIFHPPSVVLEIGGGVQSLKRWRNWLGFLKWVIPGVLVAGLALPLIRQLFW
jgi:hypothetical protein